jgi:hypothetical protein
VVCRPADGTVLPRVEEAQRHLGRLVQGVALRGVADVSANTKLDSLSDELLHLWSPARDVSDHPICQVVAVLKKRVQKVRVLRTTARAQP